MADTCPGRSPLLIAIETILVGGALVILWLWWNKQQMLSEDKGTNTDEITVPDVELRESSDKNVQTVTAFPDETTEGDFGQTMWKGVWVSDDLKDETFTNRYRSELNVDLNTGHETRKYEVTRWQSRHIIAAM